MSFKPNNQLEKLLIKVNVGQKSERFLSRYSVLPRVISNIFDFYHSLYSGKRLSQVPLSHALSQTEIMSPVNSLIIRCQNTHFPENSSLKNGSTLTHKNSLPVFNSFIDSNGFLRVNGRFSQSPTLKYNERSYSGRFTWLYL